MALCREEMGKMTKEEMHGLIAEKIDGFRWCEGGGDVRRCNHAWLLPLDQVRNMRWLKAVEKRIAPLGDDWNRLVPNYSADLNLCARAEAKVFERGYAWRYSDLLEDELDIRIAGTVDDWPPSDDVFKIATAPAEARVRAMVALIESGALEGK